MVICTKPECQTTAGCVCRNWGTQLTTADVAAANYRAKEAERRAEAAERVKAELEAENVRLTKALERIARARFGSGHPYDVFDEIVEVARHALAGGSASATPVCIYTGEQGGKV